MNWPVLAPLLIFLLIIFAVGFWANQYVIKTQSFVHEYFLGKRQLGGFILAMTMVATYGSASSFIGVSGRGVHAGAWLGAPFHGAAFNRLFCPDGTREKICDYGTQI